MIFCSSESGFNLSQMARKAGLSSPGCDAHNKILPTTDMLYKSTDILTTTFYQSSITDWRPTVVHINMANIYFGSFVHVQRLRSKCVLISFCVRSPIVERNQNKIQQWMESDAVNFLYHFSRQMSLFAISVLHLLASHREII
jgi:hypothetical protein